MSKSQWISSFLQSLPEFKGKRRVGRAVMSIAALNQASNLEVKTKRGTFVLPNLLDMVSIDIFINGYYEKGLVDHLVNNIPAKGVFLDIGANIGSVSIPVAMLRPDIRIIAVEASPWIFKFLKTNVERNSISNMTLLNYAVFSESGKTLPMYAPRDLFGKGSLKSIYTKEAEMVETVTIDAIAKQYNIPVIDYIKVDVEGFEASVFSGMHEVLSSGKPKIIFECSEWAELTAGFSLHEAQSIIISKGYKLQELDHRFQPLAEPVNKLINVKNANLFAS